MIQLQLQFDYDQLDNETRIIVQQEDKEFDRNMSESGLNFIRACKNVQRIHGALKYKRPGFVDWCNSKPGLEKSTAYKMLDVAKMFPFSGNISIDSKEALYLLAAPSTPEPARQEAIERAQNGERITHATARDIANSHKNGHTYEQTTPANMQLIDTRPLYAVDPHLDAALEDEDKSVCPECGQVYDGTACPDCRVSTPHVAYNSGDNEWYTPGPFIEAAREVMNCIDLDPASTEVANQIVGATKYYTADDDGLTKKWHGKVWMNPPYSRELITNFCVRLISEFENGNVIEAITLTNNSTETEWFQDMAKQANAICLPRGRIKFWHPEKTISTPLQGQIVMYFGDNEELFVKVFSRFGIVWISGRDLI